MLVPGYSQVMDAHRVFVASPKALLRRTLASLQFLDPYHWTWFLTLVRRSIRRAGTAFAMLIRGV